MATTTPVTSLSSLAFGGIRTEKLKILHNISRFSHETEPEICHLIFLRVWGWGWGGGVGITSRYLHGCTDWFTGLDGRRLVGGV